MELNQQCGVCYLSYSRKDRVPRILHCNHTFCTTCLETLGLYYSGVCTICCPLCRQVTWVGCGLSLQQALFVDNQLWDHISDNQEEGEDESEQKKKEEVKDCKIQALASSHSKFRVPKQHRSKLRLSSFLKFFFRHSEERIISSCNVNCPGEAF